MVRYGEIEEGVQTFFEEEVMMVTMANRKALWDGYWFLVASAAVILCFGGLSVSQGATYYVATTGNNNNPGTEVLPWRTVQKAADTMAAGDTVLIKAGTYNETVDIWRSGTVAQPITFENYPGHLPVIDGTGLGDDGIIEVDDCDHIRIRGLKLANGSGSSTSGIEVWDVDDLLIEGCYTYITRNSGIKVNYSSNVVINNNDIERACDTGGEETISIKLESYDVVVSNNHVHNSGHEGIDIKHGAHDVLVVGNYVHHMERQGLYADSWDLHTYNIEFRDNIVHDCQFGMGACAEEGGLLENVWFVNNLVYNCEGPGMFIADWCTYCVTDHPIEDAYYINNTIYNCGWQWGGGMYFDTAEANNVVVRNNILSNVSDPIRVNHEPISKTVENNLCEDASGMGPGWCIEGLPRFVSAAAGDFHIQGDSDAIDAANDVNAPDTDLEGDPRPMGWGYDIGAYEWPLGDIDGNGHIEYVDVWLLSDQWLSAGGSPSADIWPLGGDGVVDWLDFAELGKCWAK